MRSTVSAPRNKKSQAVSPASSCPLIVSSILVEARGVEPLSESAESEENYMLIRFKPWSLTTTFTNYAKNRQET